MGMGPWLMHVPYLLACSVRFGDGTDGDYRLDR
jgi:hypothetical protein